MQTTPIFPYQLDVMPFGCYCNRGHLQACPTKLDQAAQLRQQFVGDWQGALASSAPSQSVQAVHSVGQQFALRYGWPVQQRVEQLLRAQSPQLLPYLQSLGCGPLPQAPNRGSAQQGAAVYDSLLGRVF